MATSRKPTGNQRARTACPPTSPEMGQSTDYTVRDALHAAIDALGGYKTVGHLLRPEEHPETAGHWLAHCLTPGRRDKLSLDQIALIFRRAHQHGRHDGMSRLCSAFGYAPAAPIAERDVLADMQRQSMALLQRATELSTEVSERMRHAGIKVDVL
jgi:hypothetical protein